MTLFFIYNDLQLVYNLTKSKLTYYNLAYNLTFALVLFFQNYKIFSEILIGVKYFFIAAFCIEMGGVLIGDLRFEI